MWTEKSYIRILTYQPPVNEIANAAIVTTLFFHLVKDNLARQIIGTNRRESEKKKLFSRFLKYERKSCAKKMVYIAENNLRMFFLKV